MSTTSTSEFLVWFPRLAVALLVCIFVFRRLYKELPYFFLYILAALLLTGIRYAALRIGGRTYFYTYWGSDLAGSLVAVLALYEVFINRVFIAFSKVRIYRYLFPIAALVVLVLTFVIAQAAPNRGAAFLRASRAFDFVRTSFLVFFVALVVLMGRDWRRYDLGIALGFGVQATVALVHAAALIQLHYQASNWDIIEAIAYQISCAIWVVTFLVPQRSSRAVLNAQLSAQAVQQAQKWESALKEMLAGKKKGQ